jgi:hypothetical protein
MMRQERRARPQAPIIRQVQALALLPEQAARFARHAVVGDEQAPVFADRYQMAIEQPVDGGR